MLDDVERTSLDLSSGQQIALLDWGGDGPLALVHHANGFCGAVMAPLAERLRDRFRVVALDARGHGHSSKPAGRDAFAWGHFRDDLVEVATHLAAEAPGGRVALGIGHSFGGAVMLAASARRPGLFDRLVGVDPVLAGARHIALRTEQRGNVSNPMAAAARRRRHDFESLAEALASWSTKPLFAKWDPSALALYANEGLCDAPGGGVTLQCSGETEALIFESGGSLDLWAIASDVPSATLILWARHGNFPREFFYEFAALVPDARVIDVDGGHLVPMEDPALIAKLILEFAGG